MQGAFCEISKETEEKPRNCSVAVCGHSWKDVVLKQSELLCFELFWKQGAHHLIKKKILRCLKCNYKGQRIEGEEIREVNQLMPMGETNKRLLLVPECMWKPCLNPPAPQHSQEPERPVCNELFFRDVNPNRSRNKYFFLWTIQSIAVLHPYVVGMGIV